MEGKPPSAARRKPKITFSLDTPYTHVQWPVLSPDCQTEILDMLCSLLSPIGEHRSQNAAPSKGKRAKKRKRKSDKSFKEQFATSSNREPTETEALVRPEMHDHTTIGFNTTTRYLELLAQNSNPGTKDDLDSKIVKKTSKRPSINSASIMSLAAVFVTRSAHPPVLYSHLPLLTKAASLALPLSPTTRIVTLPEGAEDRLKTTLDIPRVGMIGLIDGAPSASSLIEFIRQRVPETDVPWFQETVKGAYLAVKIKRYPD